MLSIALKGPIRCYIHPNIMAFQLPVQFAAPTTFWIGICLSGATLSIATFRRLDIRVVGKLLLAGGVVLLAIAGGQPQWNRRITGSVVVMVDLSPSTRGALFRDRAALQVRVRQLVGDESVQWIGFSDHNQPLAESLADLPCSKTSYSPPPADAVLLFSDGQFDPPALAPPTYPVIDPAFDHVADAAITDLKMVGPQVFASVRNNGSPRAIRWTNALGNNPATPSGRGEVTASLAPRDLWPENDSLSILPPPPMTPQRWCVGQLGQLPGPIWQHMDPSNLPTDAAGYLGTGVIALNNISADSLSSSQQSNLLSYVRDLGGSLLIVGGDHAFAAGNYLSSQLEDLSPLASSPPQPTMQWMLLIDSSGSMAGIALTPTPFDTEITAVTNLLPSLPPNDPVSIGSFAESLTWWSAGKSARQTRSLQLPPTNIHPNGPTNLASTLGQLAADSDGSIPAQLLLMTDADTDLPGADHLADALVQKKIHLHLLATGLGSALAPLRLIANKTGGSVLEQTDPTSWISAARLLLQSALPNRYFNHPAKIRDQQRSVVGWNQTWLKSTAVELEQSDENPSFPMAARWQLGLGQVISIAYPADASTVASFANDIATQPADPRFTVSWNAGAQLAVKVDAGDSGRYLNAESITIEFIDANSLNAIPQTIPMKLSAPGEYTVSVPSSSSPRIVTVRDGGKTLCRFAVAGRYPPEFEHIGIDHENLQTLADRTGGKVIPPGPVQPIAFPRPIRQTDLTPPTAFAGFALISLGLIRARRS